MALCLTPHLVPLGLPNMPRTLGLLTCPLQFMSTGILLVAFLEPSLVYSHVMTRVQNVARISRI